MIAVELARALRTAGLRWKPTPGDQFRLESDEGVRPDPEDSESSGSDVFTVSDMTIEAHEYPTGTILGFNGTTEWALDSVSLDDALWLPREDQLRGMLRTTFRSLTREDSGPADAAMAMFTVRMVFRETAHSFSSADPADAYAEALLVLVSASGWAADAAT